MKSPLISVIIPIYNGSNYMREAIDSVIAQTYTNYEILLIDDGSIDNTWNIIQEYMQHYPNLIRGFHKGNGGVSTALNLGIKEMKGEWFAWLSHDDLWMPRKLEKQVAWMTEHPGNMMYYCGEYAMNENRVLQIKFPAHTFTRGKDLRKIYRANHISGISTLVHKECFFKVGGFREDLRCVQDADMWFKIIREFNVSGQKEPLSILRIHSAQTGVRLNSRWRYECSSIVTEWKNETNTVQFYPQMNRYNNLKIMNIIFNIRMGLLHRYVKFCATHHIPIFFRIFDFIYSKIHKLPSYESLMKP